MLSCLIESQLVFLFQINMKSFITSLFFFLSCGLGSVYTETSTHLKAGLVEILSNQIKRFSQGTEQLLWKNMSCATNEECQSYILDSKCIGNFCYCTLDNILSSDSTKCLPTATEYGSPCEDNAQCSYLLSTGGVCTDNKCACKSGYHYLKGNCWKNIDLHEKCYRDEQCFSAYEYVGLKCEKNACKCRENYYERLNSGCRIKRKADESCNLDDDCTDQIRCENMICSNSTVPRSKTANGFSDSNFKRVRRNSNCSKGMFKLNNLCLRELGMNCTKDSDCNHIKKAFCLDGSVCACEHVQYVASEDNRECLRVSRGKVEDIERTSCKKDPQCGIFGGNSFCQNKRCQCKNGTYFEKEKKFCWRIKSLNENCSDDKDCYPSATHAECRETESGKLCVCRTGYHSKGSNCFLDALEVGDSCLSDEDCLFPNSSCNDSNVCVCKENYYAEKGKCKLGVGAPGCVANTDCVHLENTECKIKEDLPVKRCLCLENHTNSDDYRYCLPVVNFKEKCKESFQCKFPMGDVGMCKRNVCECREGEHYSNGKCYRSKFIKESCSSQSECFPGNDSNSVICLKGYCSCNYDYKLDESGICVKTNSAVIMKGYSMSLLSILIFLTLRR